METFSIAVTQQADQALVTIKGELDEETADQVRAIDLSGLADSHLRSLVIDLSDLEFMDSSGIGSLVNLRNRAEAINLTTTIGRSQDHVRHTLTLAGLATLFGLAR